MNEAAKNISELLSGTYSKIIVIGGRAYVMKAPSIKVITRATRYLSLVDIPDGITVPEMMKIVSEHSKNIAKGLSYLIVGDVKDYEDESEKVFRQILSGTHEELCSAFLAAFELIAGRDFFQCAGSVMELAKMIAKTR